MRKLLWFFGLMIFAGSLSAGNLIFNPSFDMTQWDTGWTCNSYDTSFQWGNATAWALAGRRARTGMSLPNCCYLCTKASASTNGRDNAGVASASAEIEMAQNFNPITLTNCMFRAYVKYEIFGHGGGSRYGIQLHINNAWQTVWGSSYYAGMDNCATWIEVCTTFVKDTIDGIKFYTNVGVQTGRVAGGYWHNELWIDNVWIGDPRDENEDEDDEEEFRVESSKLIAFPNPFATVVNIKWSGMNYGEKFDIEIYDLRGKLVKTFSFIPNHAVLKTGVRWNGNDEEGIPLPGGIYFAKLSGREENSILKLILMR